jgi:hypothetical protein
MSRVSALTMNEKTWIKVGIGLCAVALLGVGCKSKDGGGAAASGSAAAAAAEDPNAVAVGKDIVAATGANSFTEGKVTAIEGMKVTYEYGLPDETTKKRPTHSVDKGKVFLLGVPQKAAPKVGDFIIAKGISSYWSGCEVKSDAGGVLACEDAYGKMNNVDPKTAIVPDAVTSADIKQYLARAAKHRAFDEAAKAAGKPVAPKGWKPKEKDSVAVEWMTGSWKAATVVKVEGDKITIKWDNSVWQDNDRKIDQVVPAPKAAATVKEGQFVLVHKGTDWDARKVVSATKDSAEVIDKDDTKTTVALKEVLAVGN